MNLKCGKASSRKRSELESPMKSENREDKGLSPNEIIARLKEAISARYVAMSISRAARPKCSLNVGTISARIVLTKKLNELRIEPGKN